MAIRAYCDLCETEIKTNIQESGFFFSADVTKVKYNFAMSGDAPIQATPQLETTKMHLCEKCYLERFDKK